MSKCEVCHFEDGCPPECTRERDRTKLNANGAYINENLGFHALSLAKHHRLVNIDDVTAHMAYPQRVIGDWTGSLKMGILTLDEATSAIRFKFCGCYVVEDNDLATDTVEFHDNGRVLARITNLCAKMPRFSQ